MAETFLAVPLTSDLPGFEPKCCIKRILPSYEGEQSYRAQFIAEAYVLSRFNHPNIVRAFDGGMDDGSLFLAMEYVEGVSLHQLLKYCALQQRKIPMDVAAWIAACTAEALYHASTTLGDDGKPLGVVHRDVSPSNILLDTSGHVKLVDFGIAVHPQWPQMTKTGNVRGKVSYLSPEGIHRKGLDHRSDLFSLGAVLYEMLTNTVAFVRDYTEEATMADVVAGRYEPITVSTPNLPDSLVELNAELLAKEKEHRPANGQVVAERLAPFFHAFSTPKSCAKLVVAASSGQMRSSSPPVTSNEPITAGRVRSTSEASVEVNYSAKPPLDDLAAFRPEPRTIAVDHETSIRIPFTGRKASADTGSRWRTFAVAAAVLLTTGALGAYGVTTWSISAKPAVRIEASKAASVAPKPPAEPSANRIAPAIPTTDSNSAAALSQTDPTAAALQPTEPSAAQNEPRRSATLRITVREWGFVYIDDRYYGDASQKLAVTLEPGTHTIGLTSTPNGKIEQQHKVTLRAGNTRKVFDFVKAQPARNTE